MGDVPQIHIRNVNDAQVRESGDFILYWLIANRQLHFNFVLDRAGTLRCLEEAAGDIGHYILGVIHPRAKINGNASG
jgi:hypothetical protein